MLDLFNPLPTIAVFPVLVGPLQTLLALLPAILAGAASMLFAAFRPEGFLKLVRFCWRQKLFFGLVAGIVWIWQSGTLASFLHHKSPTRDTTESVVLTNWDSARGGVRRWGRGPGEFDPTTRGIVWKNQRDKTILSSPAVAGDRVIFSTATEIGPFSPEGRGAVVCVDAQSGNEIWRYAPENYRATFSSPVVEGNFVVCGEGLHQVEDARVTCLDVRNGERLWEFRTHSHVESTPAISRGRVLFGAGDDGFYCLDLEPETAGQPKVHWHLNADRFPDCESSPAVSDGVVYFGLGDGGSAVCAVQIETGHLLWKVSTPYPVFAPPTVADGKLFIATGNGNFVQSAADLLEMKLQILRDDGASEQQLAEARERLKPIAEVWCVDLATRNIDWRFTTADAILGAIVYSETGLYFGSRDGSFYRISKSGELLNRYDTHEPLIASPALGRKHVYCSTTSGRLFCLQSESLKPVWDASLGSGDTFVSSPTIAHGHVYIGTAQDGLCCRGKPGEPDLALWTQGRRGGAADDVPVPNPAEVLWQFPPENEWPFEVTAPLMPLDGALYFAGNRRFVQAELIKLDVRTAGDSVNQAWSHRCKGAIYVAPVGCGNRICLVEEESTPSALHIQALSANDGSPLWSHTLTGPNPMRHPSRGGISLDSKRVFWWTGEATLGCYDLQTGSTLWNHSMVAPAPPPSEESVNGTPNLRGISVAVSTGEIVLVMAVDESAKQNETIVHALDAITGIALWQSRIEWTFFDSPILKGLQFSVPHGDKVAYHSIIDGSLIGELPIDRSSTIHWQAPIGKGRVYLPGVSQNGRAYVATDEGRIFCLGAKRP